MKPNANKITQKGVDEIIPYENNPRRNEKAVDKVANSIRAFGFQQPIIIDEHNVIICGHTRHKAAKKLGMDKVPCIVASGLTDEEIRAYRLADNKVAELAEWDEELLVKELASIDQIDLTGFDSTELDKLLDSDSQDLNAIADEDQAERYANQGDIFEFGPHRLMCGDSTNDAHVRSLMQSDVADMVFTDPPYNVNYSGVAGKIANDNLGEGFAQFVRAFMRNLLVFSRGAIYVCMSISEIGLLKREFCELGGHWSTFIIWAKDTFTLGRSDYHRQYEPILYGWKEGVSHYYCGDRTQGDVWEIPRPKKNDIHPTMKPVELCSRAIKNSSRRGDIVLDLFGGSGTTLIAAADLDRKCRIMELDPKFCDAILRRYKSIRPEATFKKNGKEVKITN